MADLLPCPFCGGEAEVMDDHPYVLVCCTDCSARKEATTKEDAVQRWNRRTPDLEAMRAALSSARMLIPRGDGGVFDATIKQIDAVLARGEG